MSHRRLSSWVPRLRPRHWITIPVCAAVVHSAFILVMEWDRLHGSETLQYATLFVDPIALAMAMREDASGNEAFWILLLYGGLQWVGLGLFCCCAMSVIDHGRLWNHGLCPACAYPIGTSDLCTECGKPVTPRSVEPAT